MCNRHIAHLIAAYEAARLAEGEREGENDEGDEAEPTSPDTAHASAERQLLHNSSELAGPVVCGLSLGMLSHLNWIRYPFLFLYAEADQRGVDEEREDESGE